MGRCQAGGEQEPERGQQDDGRARRGATQDVRYSGGARVGQPKLRRLQGPYRVYGQGHISTFSADQEQLAAEEGRRHGACGLSLT